MKLITDKGYSIGNIDSTICLQQPKINPHILEMKNVLAEGRLVDGLDKRQDIPSPEESEEPEPWAGAKQVSWCVRVLSGIVDELLEHRQTE